ncbi:uncharacterized protein EDB93DRAFT_1118992 [Suillus bovinus]|uniref:uncharacterized protein n=1 Tax=Suillus bovinus TaxID=48563 RepID=UPI001B86258B|nr:uncharacterized protein EDB93DRAFT_1118992 [Suillus bovinus]KAG2158578.1 hypothetical protein EDB93DRAFT_1118992 [Suillus bovinus]
MKFTSLTTIVISAAAMAGIAIASNSDTTPMNLPCNLINSIQCGTGLKGFNNGLDYGFVCGPQGTIISYAACPCIGCCEIDMENYEFECQLICGTMLCISFSLT